VEGSDESSGLADIRQIRRVMADLSREDQLNLALESMRNLDPGERMDVASQIGLYPVPSPSQFHPSQEEVEALKQALSKLAQRLEALEGAHSSGVLSPESPSREPSEEEVEAFKQGLKEMSESEINRARMSGEWGPWHKGEPTKSGWKVVAANRHLTWINEQRKQQPQRRGNLIQLGSLVIAIGALVVATLAYLSTT
jgi:hypothetical protein